MKTRVKRWGNSAVVRIPKPLLQGVGLEVDSPIEIGVVNGRLVIESVKGGEHPSVLLDKKVVVTYVAADGSTPTEEIAFRQIDWGSVDAEADVVFVYPLGFGERLPVVYSAMKIVD